jgi:hypothetical protein
MTERFKDFIARRVVHPLQGMTLGAWWALLRRHRFAVDSKYVPRALIQTTIAASNSACARMITESTATAIPPGTAPAAARSTANGYSPAFSTCPWREARRLEPPAPHSSSTP